MIDTTHDRQFTVRGISTIRACYVRHCPDAHSDRYLITLAVDSKAEADAIRKFFCRDSKVAR